MTDKEQLIWIWLKTALKDSSEKSYKVYSHFKKLNKNIYDIYISDRSDFEKVQCLSKEDIDDLLNKNTYEVASTLKACQQNNIQLITLEDERYPQHLLEIDTPPVILFAYGAYDKAIAKPMVTIVGTRECTNYGEKITKEFSQALAYCGCTIVSGIAKGIDRFAVEGAVKADGTVIMVLPAGHLSSRIETKIPSINFQKTVLLSEHLPYSPQTKFAYHERNRILSALSEFTIVTQAPEKSGALITANYALEQGKTVYSVPANIDIPQSIGSNRLFYDGAFPALSYKDVLEPITQKYPDKVKNLLTDTSLDFLNYIPDNTKQKCETFKKTFSPLLTMKENEILELFSDKPVTIDYICSKISGNVSEITSTLTSLEYNGAIVEQPGGKYILNVNK